MGFKADQLPFKDNNRSGKDKRNKDASRSDSNTRPVKKAARSSPDGLCTGCGRDNHSTEKCSFLIKKHPEANTSDKPWLQSEHGIAWKEKDPKVIYLPGGKLLDGSSWESKKDQQQKPYNKHKGDKPKHFKSELKNDIEYLTALASGYNDHMTMPCTLSVNNSTLNVHALIDTGALQNNFVNLATAAWIKG